MTGFKKEVRNQNRVSGLSSEDVDRSRALHGRNVFTKKKRKGFVAKYFESFGDPIIKILLITLGVNVVLMFQTKNVYETVGIAAAVFLATFVSTLSEYGSESAFIKLQKEAENLKCRVVRGGETREVAITEVVVGDLVLLSAGEKVPADGFLVSGALSVDQSAINGESKEANKIPSAIETDGSPSAINTLFRGTSIQSGEGMMEVTSVGDRTLYGHLARELQTDVIDSPMKARLAVLAKQISRLGYTAAALIAFADLFNAIVMDNHYNADFILAELRNIPIMAQNLMHSLLLAISVVVVAVPEGLPMMITVVLSSNMMRMQKDHVMVRKLIGIETAGSINILFSDKTGTLTTGNIAVEKVVCGSGRAFREMDEMKKIPVYEKLIALSCLCNGTAVIADRKIVGGNSTERALVSFAAKKEKDYRKVLRVESMPFNSTKKYAWTKIQDEKESILIKGAPEKLLPRCKGYYDENGNVCSGMPSFLKEQMQNFTSHAMRCLVLATADGDFEDKKTTLTFIALVAMRDSLRPEIIEAVTTVKKAGIQPVMITGDHKETAVAIAEDAGILTKNAKEIVLGGEELAQMSDDEIKSVLPYIRVIARALPTDKSRLVRLSQEMGLVVGMTGDGINDATALKSADVGFSMGNGTEVAKEASDIVILDNNFASIVKAILYGRTIFHSIRKFIVFQLTMNFCAVGVSLIGPFIGVDTPVTVMQMLWINIIMDTLAGLAFAGEAPQRSYMEEKPKSRLEPIITREMLGQILITGGYTIFLCASFLKMTAFRDVFHFSSDFVGFMTAFFTLFVFCGIFNAFNARTSRIRLFVGLGKNKTFLWVMLFVSAVQIALIFFGGTLFRTHALSCPAIKEIVLLAFTVIPFDLVRKILSRIFSTGN